MKKIYLDYNVFIYIKEQFGIDLLDEIIENNKIYYSPAHVEEIYKACDSVDDPANYEKCMIDIISKITKSNEILPSLETAFKFDIEEINDCMTRVKNVDTKNIVKKNSTLLFDKYNSNFKKIVKNDKKHQNISNESNSQIWNNKYIKCAIDSLNRNIDKIISDFNLEIKIIDNILGVNGDRCLPSCFMFKSNYLSTAKRNHTETEFIFEILFILLNYYGYNSDKKEKTAISNTHDISHAIYASSCDYLFTCDKKFYKRCKAVYHFLGIKTKVVHIPVDNVAEKLLDFYQKQKNK